MHNPSTVPRWVQILTGLGLGAIALSALKVDIVNNYEYGNQISAELATVMVIAAVCVGALPAIAAVFGWSGLLRSLTAVCILLTCWAAINTYTQKMGAEILGKTSQAAHYAAAEKDQAAARRALERITETTDTETLQQMATDAKKTADKLAAGDTAKMGSESCFKPCREAKANHQAVLNRLGEAKARDAAKAELAAAKTDAKAGPAEASMVATWIAARTENDAADIARTIALVMTVLGIIVTQGVALLAHMAASLISSGIKGTVVAEPEEAAIEAKTPGHGPAITSEAEALDWLQRKIRSSPGRIYRGSANKFADENGLARSTFASWVKRWTEEGKLQTRRSGRLTEFSFPDLRRVA